jgi:hypothetical protein
VGRSSAATSKASTCGMTFPSPVAMTAPCRRATPHDPSRNRQGARSGRQPGSARARLRLGRLGNRTRMDADTILAGLWADAERRSPAAPSSPCRHWSWALARARVIAGAEREHAVLVTSPSCEIPACTNHSPCTPLRHPASPHWTGSPVAGISAV